MSTLRHVACTRCDQVDASSGYLDEGVLRALMVAAPALAELVLAAGALDVRSGGGHRPRIFRPPLPPAPRAGADPSTDQGVNPGSSNDDSDSDQELDIDSLEAPRKL